jgi:hypothetical protein
MSNTTPSPASWRAVSATTPGRSHLLDGVPCQDAASAMASPRPHIIVCDGRGSAPLSHLGSERATRAFTALVRAQEDLLACALDAEGAPAGGISPSEAWRHFALSAWRALGDVQKALASERGGEPQDYEFTLAAAVAGKRRVGCLQVGDSLLVLARGTCAGLVFPPDGEANTSATWFVTPDVSPKGLLRAGLFPSKNLTGIAAFTDGVASRYVSLHGHYPAQLFHPLFEDLSKNLLSRQMLHALLSDEAWTPATGDDRGIALLAPSAHTTAGHDEGVHSDITSVVATDARENRQTDDPRPADIRPPKPSFQRAETGKPASRARMATARLLRSREATPLLLGLVLLTQLYLVATQVANNAVDSRKADRTSFVASPDAAPPAQDIAGPERTKNQSVPKATIFQEIETTPPIDSIITRGDGSD